MPNEKVLDNKKHISNLPIEIIKHITSYLYRTPWGLDVETGLTEETNNNDDELILAGLISVGYDVGLIN